MNSLANLAIGAVVLPTMALMAPAANAAILLENLYAREFCSLRADGFSQEQAVKGAVDASSVSGTPTRLTRADGTTIDADTVRAVRAAYALCPSSFK